MIQVDNLSGGYSQQEIVKQVSFEAKKGTIVGILGPNGSGKSTLLKLITGIIKPTAGVTKIDGQPLSAYSSKQLAKKMAVLPQVNASAFSNTVYETVSIGRYPYQSGLFSKWTEEDERAVQQAMEQTGVARYAQSDLSLLSGGEQQRVFIAQALAQQAEVLLLDEPTNHLDIAHQKQILDVIREQAKHYGLTVISIFHDINLASIYCDQLILMKDGAVQQIGKPHEVVQQPFIEQVYEANVQAFAHPTVPAPQITMLPKQHGQQLMRVTAEQFVCDQEGVKLQASQPLKVISSAVYNAGLGWYTTFLNRTVAHDYNSQNVSQEMLHYLQQHNYTPTSTVAMLTAIQGTHAQIKTYCENELEVTVMVTAGVGKAIDVSQSTQHTIEPHVGTINTWIFINGIVAEEAFLQAMVTATEAKTKALAQLQVKDYLTGTVATGTATDSVLVAATQQGPSIQYAGTITEIGKLIGKGVYEMTVAAIEFHEQNK